MLVQLTTVLAGYATKCWENGIHLNLSTGFALSVLSSFYLTICTSYFSDVLHLLVFFLEMNKLVFYSKF